MKRYSFLLREINSPSAISSEALDQLAEIYGVSSDTIITYAITEWAKFEFPEIDFNVPHLSEVTISQLQKRRAIFESECHLDPNRFDSIAYLEKAYQERKTIYEGDIAAYNLTAKIINRKTTIYGFLVIVIGLAASIYMLMND